MPKRRFRFRQNTGPGPFARALLTLTGLAIAAVIALGLWFPWYFINTWRLATQGWMTTVDRALFASNAADTYGPLEQVPGDSEAVVLPRATSDESRFAEAIATAARMESYSLLIWHNGTIVLEKYWPGADRESRPDGASMHKTVTALAIGAAIAGGKIGSIDDPVEKYLTEWRGLPKGKITIRNLLNMASGLGTFSQEGGWISESNRFLAGLMPEQLVLGRDLLVEPGSAFTYRNLNTQLLGVILERATGMRYAEYLSQSIWRPLGAADAQVWLDRDRGLARTYTALLARAEDWLRLGLLIKDLGALVGRPVLPAEWIEAMIAPSPMNANYGFQIWRAHPYQARRYYNPALKGLSTAASEPTKAEDMVFFDGVGGQRVYISRAQDLVIVRLGVARPDWDDSALPNAVITALAPITPTE